MPSRLFLLLRSGVFAALSLLFLQAASPVFAEARKLSEVDRDIQQLQQSIAKLRGEQGREEKALEKTGREVAALLLDIRQQHKTIRLSEEKREALSSEKKS